MHVATAQQLMAYDRGLVDNGYTMEALVDMAAEILLPQCQEYSDYVIFCGNGNNGSDGLSLATKLWRQGKAVQVVLVSDSQRRGSLNDRLLQSVEALQIPVQTVGEALIISEGALIVDAILGFGFVGTPRANSLRAIEMINAANATVLSVDIPSGLHCNQVQPHSPMVKAHKTVSFVAMKQGFLNPESHQYLGDLMVAPLPVEPPEVTPPLATLYDETLAQSTLKPRAYDSYKGKNGHALLLTGSQAYMGAGLLSTKACVYSGCGLTTWCGTTELAQLMVGNTPELIAIAPENLPEKLQGKTAVLVGSGLDLKAESEEYLRFVLTQTKLPVVIDGDGLTLLAQDQALLEMARNRAILTPHMGEFRRFVPEDGEALDQAVAFAKTQGVVVVLKGPATIVTDGQSVFRGTTGNQRMATAGSGDVLAGLMVGLLAGDYTAMEAANLAVYIHGAAGDMIGQSHYTAIPSLVIEAIAKVMEDIHCHTQQHHG